jgi:hypothetical protein
MFSLIPVCLSVILAGPGVVALAIGFSGWLYWRHLREKREQDTPERQRERLRREYWAQVKS